jgi:hypothetical protein
MPEQRLTVFVIQTVPVELLPETKGTTHLINLGTVYTYARSNVVLSPADMVKRDRIRKLLDFLS